MPTKYELVISVVAAKALGIEVPPGNLPAAKALGLGIPPTLLARADEVIE